MRFNFYSGSFRLVLVRRYDTKTFWVSCCLWYLLIPITRALYLQVKNLQKKLGLEGYFFKTQSAAAQALKKITSSPEFFLMKKRTHYEIHANCIRQVYLVKKYLNEIVLTTVLSTESLQLASNTIFIIILSILASQNFFDNANENAQNFRIKENKCWSSLSEYNCLNGKTHLNEHSL